MRKNLNRMAAWAALLCAALLWMVGCAAGDAPKSGGRGHLPPVRVWPMAPEAAAPSVTPDPADVRLPPETRLAGGHVVVLSRVPESEARALLLEANRTLEDMGILLDLSPSDAVVTIHFFDTRPLMLAYLATASPGPVESDAVCFYTAQGPAVALFRQNDAQETLRQLRHEVAGVVVMDRFLEAPPWIREGLASYFEAGPPYGRPNMAALERLRGELEEGREGTLAALVNVPLEEPLDAKGAARAWALTQFLMTQTEEGPAAVKKYLDLARVGQPPAVQFTRAFGVAPGDLEPAWRLYLAQMTAPAKN